MDTRRQIYLADLTKQIELLENAEIIQYDGSDYKQEFEQLYCDISEAKSIACLKRIQDAHIRLYRRIYSFSFPECLLEMLNLLAVDFPEQIEHLQAYLMTFDFANPVADKKIILKGDVQSGKTSMMILISLAYLLCGKNVVILLRNRLDDATQFKDRFKEFVAHLATRGFTHPRFETGVFVYIYSTQNVKKIKARFAGSSTPTVLMVDEADVRDEMKDRDFARLVKRLNTTIFVSATIQDILVEEWNVDGNHIVSLPRQPCYKSLSDVQFNLCDDLDTDDGMFYAFCDVAVDPVEQPWHPKIVLVSIERRNMTLDRLFDCFCADEFALENLNTKVHLPVSMQNRVVIEYTGAGIKLFHPSLKATEFQGKKVRTSRDGFVHFKSGMMIKHVLLWLAQHGGAERFPNVVIVSGLLASRGINFACYSDRPEECWHITHQILLRPKSSSASTVIQALRILGCFKDDIPLKVWTTTKIQDKIHNAVRLSNDIVSCLTQPDHPLHKPAFYEQATNLSLKLIPINKKAKPERFLARRNDEASLKLVHEGGLGAPEEEEKMVAAESPLTMQTDLEHSKYLMSQRSRESTRISTFLRNIDPCLIYTEKELKDLLQPHSISVFDVTTPRKVANTYGAIIQRLEDNTFRLQPSLVHSYNQYFNQDDL